MELAVARVGAVKARKPTPRAVAALSMTGNDKVDPTARLDYFTRFVMDHLDEGEYEWILSEMLCERLPHDAVQRVARAVATWGTERPYTAVMTLSVFTGHNWRNIRQKLANAGIESPLRLPSLHALLDITEDIVVESLLASGEDRDGPPSEGEKKLARFYDAIYAPDPPDEDEEDLRGLEYRPVPTDFIDANAVEDDFDAFLRTAR